MTGTGSGSGTESEPRTWETHFRDLLLLHQRLLLRRDGPLAFLRAEGGGSVRSVSALSIST